MVPLSVNEDGELTIDINNLSGTILASAARTATPTAVDQTNLKGRSLHIVLDVIVAPNSPSIVLKIEGKDIASGKYYTILESAAVVGVSTNIYKVAPWIAAVANLAVADEIPTTWRVTVTHGNTDSITYSIGYNLGI